jgi:two-component system response regulator RegA
MSGGGVLIIDDDADVRRAARVALLQHVAMVESSASPQALDEQLAEQKFAAVLLDMNFVAGERSGNAGLDSLARIRATDPSMAVVLMTAFGGVALAVESLKRGAADFVLKPWHNDKLVTTVVAAMQTTQLRRQSETVQLDALERGAIERSLARHKGNVSLAAAELGLSRPALYRRISKHGL